MKGEVPILINGEERGLAYTWSRIAVLEGMLDGEVLEEQKNLGRVGTLTKFVAAGVDMSEDDVMNSVIPVRQAQEAVLNALHLAYVGPLPEETKPKNQKARPSKSTKA